MLDRNNIPQHVAIIMDGNGGWARERGLPRTAGHRAGIKRVKEVVAAAAEYGVKVLTLFAFSTENWKRSKQEVHLLMRSLQRFLDSQAKELNKNNIRFKVIGESEPLPKYILDKIKGVENQTANNTGMTLVLALNYGSRQEIIKAAARFAADVIKGKAELEDLDIDRFAGYLYTDGLPDPDLLIRTSGQARISNFLLWQISYAELYFPKKHWPDFGRQDLEEAIKIYQERERRFGGINAAQKDN